MKNKRLLPGDIVLSAVIIIISLSVYIGMFLFGSKAEYSHIEIYCDGTFVAELSLSQETVFDVPECDFSIEIKDKTASVLHTDCNDRVCEKMTAGTDGGEIICLPNRIVVRAKGTERSDTDLVAG